jgi:hypothetical protein
VYVIIQERQMYDLSSYCQLTYLGLLWADTALLIAKQLAIQSPTEEISKWFNRRRLYVEELAAHNLAPCLMHPASLAPFGIAEYQRASHMGILNPDGLYRGAGHLGQYSFAPEDTWPRIQAYSATAKKLKESYTPYDDYLHSALKEHLVNFVMTMKLGTVF